MTSDSPQDAAAQPGTLTQMRTSEDWWAIWCGTLLIVVAFLAVWCNRPDDFTQKIAEGEVVEVSSPLKPWL
ncbi:MAG: putative sulfate exporter family transporter, partial [Fuerstiella sp.]